MKQKEKVMIEEMGVEYGRSLAPCDGGARVLRVNLDLKSFFNLTNSEL